MFLQQNQQAEIVEFAGDEAEQIYGRNVGPVQIFDEQNRGCGRESSCIFRTASKSCGRRAVSLDVAERIKRMACTGAPLCRRMSTGTGSSQIIIYVRSSVPLRVCGNPPSADRFGQVLAVEKHHHHERRAFEVSEIVYLNDVVVFQP